MREIYFYRAASGDSPVEGFLAELSTKQAQKVAWVLKLVKELPIVPKQFFKKLEGTQESGKCGPISGPMHSGRIELVEA